MAPYKGNHRNDPFLVWERSNSVGRRQDVGRSFSSSFCCRGERGSLFLGWTPRCATPVRDGTTIEIAHSPSEWDHMRWLR